MFEKEVDATGYSAVRVKATGTVAGTRFFGSVGYCVKSCAARWSKKITSPSFNADGPVPKVAIPASAMRGGGRLALPRTAEALRGIT